MFLNFFLLTLFLTLLNPTLACKCFHLPDHSTGWDLPNTVGCCRYVYPPFPPFSPPFPTLLPSPFLLPLTYPKII